MTAAELLSRYNLAQLQACLYQCQRMSVEASTDFAAIVRYAKLCRLLVETRRIAPFLIAKEPDRPGIGARGGRTKTHRGSRFFSGRQANRFRSVRFFFQTPNRARTTPSMIQL